MTERETIALFGATGCTGKYFLKHALEKGFRVRACVRTPSKVPADLQDQYKDSLTLIEGSFTERDVIAETIQGATYVVSMAGQPVLRKNYPTDTMLNFATTLTQVIQEQNNNVNPSSDAAVKVVLYQADAFSPTPDRPLTRVNKVMKKVVGEWMVGIGPNVQDNTNVVKYFYDNKNTLGFQVIVSRPATLTDKPVGGNTTCKKEELNCKADHFSSTHFAISLQDMAAWSLRALQDSSLYGTFPFVVPVDKDILPRRNKKKEQSIAPSPVEEQLESSERQA